MQTLTTHDYSVCPAVCSADGSSVLIASHDRIAKIFNRFTGKSMRTLAEQTSEVKSALLSTYGSAVLLYDLEHLTMHTEEKTTYKYIFRDKHKCQHN